MSPPPPVTPAPSRFLLGRREDPQRQQQRRQRAPQFQTQVAVHDAAAAAAAPGNQGSAARPQFKFQNNPRFSSSTAAAATGVGVGAGPASNKTPAKRIGVLVRDTVTGRSQPVRAEEDIVEGSSPPPTLPPSAAAAAAAGLASSSSLSSSPSLQSPPLSPSPSPPPRPGKRLGTTDAETGPRSKPKPEPERTTGAGSSSSANPARFKASRPFSALVLHPAAVEIDELPSSSSSSCAEGHPRDGELEERWDDENGLVGRPPKRRRITPFDSVDSENEDEDGDGDGERQQRMDTCSSQDKRPGQDDFMSDGVNDEFLVEGMEDNDDDEKEDDVGTKYSPVDDEDADVITTMNNNHEGDIISDTQSQSSRADAYAADTEPPLLPDTSPIHTATATTPTPTGSGEESEDDGDGDGNDAPNRRQLRFTDLTRPARNKPALRPPIPRFKQPATAATEEVSRPLPFPRSAVTAAAAAAAAMSSTTASETTLRQQQQQPDAPLDAFFSPHGRRGAAPRYLPGGLAAELRDWLLEAKQAFDDEDRNRGVGVGVGGRGGGGDAFAASTAAANHYPPHHRRPRSVRLAVAEARSGGPGITLVRGRPAEGEDAGFGDARAILAGEGMMGEGGVLDRGGLGGGGRGPWGRVGEGMVVTVVPPAWNLELEGQAWSVVPRWAVFGRDGDGDGDGRGGKGG